MRAEALVVPRRTVAALAMILGIAGVAWVAVQHRTVEGAALRRHAAQPSEVEVPAANDPTPVVSEAPAVAPTQNGSGSAQLVAQADAATPLDPAQAAHEANGKLLQATETLYQETHAAEAVDPQWSQVADQTIANTYGGDDLALLHLKADCRSTLCRVDVDYSDPTAGKGAANKFLSLQPWPGKRMTHLNDDTRSGTAYFAREGFEFPVLQNDASTP